MTTTRSSIRFLAQHVRAHPRAYVILSTYVLAWLLSGYAYSAGRAGAAWLGGVLVGLLTGGYVLGALYVHTSLLDPASEPVDGTERSDPPPNRSSEELGP